MVPLECRIHAVLNRSNPSSCISAASPAEAVLLLLLLQQQGSRWLQVADEQHQPVDEEWQQRWLACKTATTSTNRSWCNRRCEAPVRNKPI
jgi:hypothetical protein